MKFVCYCSSNFNFVFLKITPKAYRYFWESSEDMCAKNYFNVNSFGKVIAETKGCSFLGHSVDMPD